MVWRSGYEGDITNCIPFEPSSQKILGALFYTKITLFVEGLDFSALFWYNANIIKKMKQTRLDYKNG